MLDPELSPLAWRLARDDLEVEGERVRDHLAQTAELDVDDGDALAAGVLDRGVDDG